jgi:hypothetical protein
VRLARGEPGHDELEVARIARVIETRRTIDLTPAGSEVNDEAAPPELFEATQKAHGIVGAGRALEPVENDHERRATLAAGQPVEIDEVAVGRLDPLAPHLRTPAAAEQGTP